MTAVAKRDLLFSFFMFTADLRPGDDAYAKVLVAHMKKLQEIGYDGFDLPIAPGATLDHRGEIESYQRLRDALDDAGLTDLVLTTNVGATRTFDPSSMYSEQRKIALDYLKSRVDITRVLRAGIMAGPIILPYGVFPTTDSNQPIWSDDLQEWLLARYHNATPILEALGDYAAQQRIKIAIEPVDHWETPAPNLVSDVAEFLDEVNSAQVGVCVDSAHVVLGSSGPEVYRRGMEQFLDAEKLNYVHLSAPDRGSIHDSWIPWERFLQPIYDRYRGPYLVEVFNAVPVFLNSLRLTRRKFWIPGEDSPAPDRPDAYAIARDGLAAVHQAFENARSMAGTKSRVLQL